MYRKQSEQGHNFTFEYNEIVRSLHTPIEIESAIKTEGIIKIDGLWDTGAGCSLIRPEVASRLSLQRVSETFISTPSGKNIPSKVYLVNIYLPNNAKIPNLLVVEGIPNSCDMLIGMDVINYGDFAISNYNGKTTFSFRMPSLMKIDFCK
jgi:predicted aspartyl protease